MKYFLSFALTVSLCSSPLMPLLPVSAGKFPDGTVFFARSPRLVNATTTFSSVRVWGAKYYFTIAIPEDAGEPLQKVTIQQRQGSEEIEFYLEQTFAFTGTPSQRKEKLTVQTVTEDDQTNTISIILQSPLPPSNTFTIGLIPKRNPRYEGIYLFGVTAFPAGEKTEGLYLGVGRLQFYLGGDGVL